MVRVSWGGDFGWDDGVWGCEGWGIRLMHLCKANGNQDGVWGWELTDT
jgi:hypothetical protein